MIYPNNPNGSLTVFTGNRIESLVERLADVLRLPLGSPFSKETIIVQGKGMERWVSIELAKIHGIWANYWFPFPNAFLNDLFEKLIPDMLPKTVSDKVSIVHYDAKTMAWHIMSMLHSMSDIPEFKTIKHYLDFNNTSSDLKRLQLAIKISGLFDQYLLYRPEMITKWEQSLDDSDWQAILWRKIMQDDNFQINHGIKLKHALLERIGKKQIPKDKIPERISIFAISSLPKFHMEIFYALSRITNVYWFILNPCQEYWFDIVSEKEISKQTEPHQMKIDELHYDIGNRLLASLGHLGKEFHYMFNEIIGNGAYEEQFDFQPPEPNDLLTCIQSDIFNLVDRVSSSVYSKSDNFSISADDRSIVIHCCHSPMREVEILYDNLLAMFDNDNSLLPKDIAVMMPDIELYAPYIRAVFDSPSDESMKIPYSIADQSIRRQSEIIETFLAILDLSGSRFAASEVLAILENYVVRRRFGLSEDEMETIYRWIDDVRIRWGLDAKSRENLGFDEFQEYSWKMGLDSLLLGYAMPVDSVFNDIYPYPNIEGSDIIILEKLLTFTKILFSNIQSLGWKRRLVDWVIELRKILDQCFFPNESDEHDMQVIRKLLGEMEAQGKNHDEKLSFDIIRWYLKDQLENTDSGFGFLAGKLTFCAMLPMRAIPFKVICLLGMNDNDYPRSSRKMNFDLIAKNPRIGDRSKKNDDKYIFLESIISARKCLYISYIGLSAEDNTEYPPSIVVRELIDYIKKGFDNELPFTVKHRLQAYNQAYFDNTLPMSSFSRDNYEACCSYLNGLKAQRYEYKPFINNGLTILSEKKVNIDELVWFFINPSKSFLKKRLGIYLKDDKAVIEDREIFTPDGLDSYILGEDIIEQEHTGQDADITYKKAKAKGELPMGNIGKMFFENTSSTIKRIFAQVDGIKDKVETIPVDLKIGGYNITGRIKQVYKNGLFYFRYSKVKPKDHIRLWIPHLILNILNIYDESRLSSVLAGSDNIFNYSHISESHKLMEELLETYEKGLQYPIRFFPNTSFLYAEKIKNQKGHDESFHKAKEEWEGSDYHRGEKEEVHFGLCFKHVDPFNDEFFDLSQKIATPILNERTSIVL